MLHCVTQYRLSHDVDCCQNVTLFRGAHVHVHVYVYVHVIVFTSTINPLTPNDLQSRRAVSPLKIKIPSKNVREKPTNTPIIHSVY
jgi:hypothetical protein